MRKDHTRSIIDATLAREWCIRVRAIDVLGKYAIMSNVGVDDVKQCLRQTTEEIRLFLPAEQADALLSRIRPIWLNL